MVHLLLINELNVCLNENTESELKFNVKFTFKKFKALAREYCFKHDDYVPMY